MAEIQTSKKLDKRVIPLQVDDTPLDHDPRLDGLLGIPFADRSTGMLLLQRALLMLMASDNYREASWFTEAFGNVEDLGGYLNYVNTYRLAQNKNDDGNKDEWVSRLESLQKQNEFIRQQLFPEINDKMQHLKEIMRQLEKGNASKSDLIKWMQWCQQNEGFQPDLIKKLIIFINKDIERLSSGGVPVSVLDIDTATKAVERLTTAINQKKNDAHLATVAKIKKYAGLFLGHKTIMSIVNSYMNYVTLAPIILKQLIDEASLSEYVAVKEATVKLVNYLEGQNHANEMQRTNLDGYFDDAYLITNTVKLLLEAKLVVKDRFTLDFVSENIIDNYVGFLLDKNTKGVLEIVLQQIRTIIGLKKNEINWGQIAALVLGALVVGSITSELSEGFGCSDAVASTGPNPPYFEDQVANFSAKYNLGINTGSPIQY